MFKNYIKTAWRNLAKNKTFSIINIVGLSVGISVCFIIMLFIQDELSYDKFNKDSDRIVRVVFKANINGGKINEANVMPPVAKSMKNDYAEVEDATRLHSTYPPKITYGDKIFKEQRLAFVDANFFHVFTLPFIKGNVKTALLQPHTVVITKETASKFFGNEEAIGKVITFNNYDNALYKITGVIDNIPSNSHFHYDLFASMESVPDAKANTWMSSNYFTYLVLKKGYDYKNLEAKLPAMVEKYMGPEILKDMGMSLSQFRTKGNELGFALQPLTDIHLYSHSNAELEAGGDAKYVYIFGAIAIFMLVIACINFINLSTAGAARRAKEVGVRKVIGSGRGELIKQFLTESVLLTLFALLISAILIKLALPVFNNLSAKSLAFGIDVKPLLAFIVLGLLVGIAAGIYPAFYLSSFKPIAVLKGRFNGGSKRFSMRSGLVVFQFFISITLIIATIVVYQQMKFIQNKKLGYNKEQLLIIPNSFALGKNETVFKEQLLKDTRIVDATISAYKPAGPSNNNNALAYPEGKDNQIMKTLEYHVDEHYIPTLGMEMAAGRNFSKEFTTDSSAMIINETAANAFGWQGNAVGQRIVRQNSERGKDFVYTVIGVVKDFNFKSLHEHVTPLLMVLQPEWGLIVKVKTADMSALLSSIKQQWDFFNTGEPFTYTFMDDLYNKTYAAEEKTGRILNIFAALTIFIACLGLFGLATYTAEQRTKEIGIRKVLGASVRQVTNMLSKDFIGLVLVSCIFAFPISYWTMHNWLQDFAYRIDINWTVFVMAAAAAVTIALLTVSFQAIKAAVANPVKSLRSE